MERLPAKLSPSRAKDFMSCPKKFYFKTILGLPQLPSRPAAIGTTAHTAFERIFDLEREARTVEAAVSFVRPAWESMLDPLKERELVEPGSPEDAVRSEGKLYRDLIEPGSRSEKRALESAESYGTLCETPQEHEQFIAEAELMVSNWFTIENPMRFDPDGRELYLSAEIAGVPMHGFIDRLDRVSIDGVDYWYISDYKGLALDTPLATPGGWVTMGDVAVGDVLLGADGRPCAVEVKSGVHNRRCYEISFDDDSSIVCDHVHLWSVIIGSGPGPEVVDTDRLAEVVGEGGDVWVANTTAVVGNDTEVPIEAALLAVELAERAHRDASPLGQDPSDWWEEALRCVLRSDAGGRLAFVNAMIAVAGRWAGGGGRVLSRDEQLVRAVAEAVVSLGGVAVVDELVLPGVGGEAVEYSCVRFGRDAGALGEPGWDAEEESGGVVAPGELAGGRRRITAVSQIDSVPTACVSVNSPDSLYLAGHQMVPTHNTGKVPQDRYLADNFFAMRVYAALLAEIRGVIPAQLRLVYVKVPGTDSIKRMDVTPRLIESTQSQLKAVWRSIRSAAHEGDFPTKTGPLCNWCDFKDICPAFHPELDGLLAEEVALRGEA
jgi:RecB family exonuclease